jgi:kynurenine formamidase
MTSPDETEILAYFERLSNAGRWGNYDELGTLNLITAEKRVQAARLVQSGAVVSCSWVLEAGDAPDQVYGPMHRYMLMTGQGLQDEHQVDTAETLNRGPIEYVGLVYHGHHVTHLDALCHSIWDKRMYNGVPASEVSAVSGANRLAVTVARQGIVTRGILLDVARSRGVDWLEPGVGVTPDDLNRAAAECGVEPSSGDAVLLRTGYGARRRARGRENLRAVGMAGWDASCLPWLRERDIAVIGADSAQEVHPSPYPAFGHGPVHRVGIVAMGLWLLDNCDLEELAEACAQHGRWEFQFVLAPLPIEGGTGSPANPLAVF